MRYYLMTALILSGPAMAAPSLRVSGVAWSDLSADEKAHLQSRFIVELVPPDAFGLIVDNQAADRSTPDSKGGTALGAAIGGAAYIDRSLSSNKYSALANLGVAVVGGIVGGALLDRPGKTEYQFRYAVRLGNGSVVYQDAYSSEPFRHPVGVCVAYPGLTLIPEQHLCAQTPESLRGTYLQTFVNPPAKSLESAVAGAKNGRSGKVAKVPSGQTIAVSKVAEESAQQELVNCKIENHGAVRTTQEKCALINGVIQ